MPKKFDRTDALGVAARVWTDPAYEHIVMNPDLAEHIADLLLHEAGRQTVRGNGITATTYAGNENTPPQPFPSNPSQVQAQILHLVSAVEAAGQVVEAVESHFSAVLRTTAKTTDGGEVQMDLVVHAGFLRDMAQQVERLTDRLRSVLERSEL